MHFNLRFKVHSEMDIHSLTFSKFVTVLQSKMYINENGIILHIISMIMILVTAEDYSRSWLYSSVFPRCAVSDTRQEAQSLTAQCGSPAFIHADLHQLWLSGAWDLTSDPLAWHMWAWSGEDLNNPNKALHPEFQMEKGLIPCSCYSFGLGLCGCLSGWMGEFAL